MDTATTPILGPMPKTPEWYAKRLWLDGEGVFGASDAAALCGMSEYENQQPLNVYRRCLGLETVEETEAMRMGTKLEPVILGIYGERAGVELASPLPMVMNRTRPYLAATVDARRLDTERIVEAKSTTFRRAKQLGEAGSDWVPDDWYLQVQQQLLVTGEQIADLAVLIDRDTFRVYEIARSEDVIAEITAAADEMRQRILDRNPPEPNWTHPGTPALVKAMYGLMDTVVVLDATVLEWWKEQARLNDEIERLKKERELLRARVADAMGHAAIGRFPGNQREIVRQKVQRKEYTVKATSYVSMRERNAT